MKKLLFAILLILLVPGLSWGTTNYYAGKAGNVNADDVWYTDANGTCDGVESSLTPGATVLADSNATLHANGCDHITVNANITAKKLTNKTDGESADGGHFTVATAASPLTISVSDIESGTYTTKGCLEVTGATAGWTVNVAAPTITGGSANGAYGLTSSHSAGTLVITGSAKGGTNAGAVGYAHSGNGATTISGNCGDSLSIGIGCSTSGGTIAVAGNCQGGADVASFGCYALGSNAITVAGNIINTATSTGVRGRIVWAPSAVTKSIKFDGGGTAVWAGISAGCTAYNDCTGAPAVTKTGTNFLNNTDGTMDAGSATGGGGAWAQ